MELVVMVDEAGLPIGTEDKATVHTHATGLHLAFSCYVFGPGGQFLCTRRASGKRTWPGVWTNSCCGHPRPGEYMAEAMVRRLDDELGLTPREWGMVLPDFRYRAVMDDGVVENEICPVFVAFVDHEPRPDPSEVEDYAWIGWPGFRSLVRSRALSVSPWCGLQIEELGDLGDDPRRWPRLGPDELPDRWRHALSVPIGSVASEH